MLTAPLSSKEAWVAYLGGAELPVLRRTVEQLARLKENEDRVAGRDISQVIMRDPMMTLKVLRYLQTQRRGSHATEITTIGRAIMMLGVTPFFRHFSELSVAEDVFAERPLALEGLRKVAYRSYRAALYARDWSALRHDIEAEEIAVAALLHDMAEVLLWCCAPELALRIARLMQRDARLRSAVVQKAVLGFPSLELQLALAKEWRLPQLLQSLMDDQRAESPRAHTVLLAVALARHSARGWDNPALPDDCEAVQKFLNVPPSEVAQSIRRATALASSDCEWYGLPPLDLPPPPEQNPQNGG